MNKVDKMEQALSLALSLLDLGEGCAYKTVRQQDIDAIKAALAAPKRNCDAGTAEEQSERFYAFCNVKSGGVCIGCPIANPGDCSLQWAQMPYESE